MNPKTERFLEHLGRSVPKELKRKLFRKERPMAEEGEKMKRLAHKHQGRLIESRAKKLKEMANNPAYDREELVVNEDAAKEIQDYYDVRIKEAIRRKEIEPYRPDAQARDIMKRASKPSAPRAPFIPPVVPRGPSDWKRKTFI